MWFILLERWAGVRVGTIVVAHDGAQAAQMAYPEQKKKKQELPKGEPRQSRELESLTLSDPVARRVYMLIVCFSPSRHNNAAQECDLRLFIVNDTLARGWVGDGGSLQD